MVQNRKILVEVSARHVHVTAEHARILFGNGWSFQKERELSQPGQYAAKEFVTVVGPKGELSCRVVVPERKETQVELAASECRKLGFPIVMRVSGTLQHTPGCVLKGPKGEIKLTHGLIVAQRHLHISPEQAIGFGVKHGEIISIRTFGSRPVTFHDVVVRSREDVDNLSFMIDTDEANASGLEGNEQGEIV